MKPITMKTQLKDLVAMAKENPGHQAEVTLNEENQSQVLIKIYVGAKTVSLAKQLDEALLKAGAFKPNSKK